VDRQERAACVRDYRTRGHMDVFPCRVFAGALPSGVPVMGRRIARQPTSPKANVSVGTQRGLLYPNVFMGYTHTKTFF
jgi:hypothetical protein